MLKIALTSKAESDLYGIYEHYEPLLGAEASEGVVFHIISAIRDAGDLPTAGESFRSARLQGIDNFEISLSGGLLADRQDDPNLSNSASTHRTGRGLVSSAPANPGKHALLESP